MRPYPAKVSSGVFLHACTEIDSQCCRRGPANSQDDSDVPTVEDLISVGEYMDHTTITADASRNLVLAAKAKDLNPSLAMSDEMKVRTCTV